VNDPAGVPIDSLCRPSSSPQAITAGCAGKDGAALTDSSTACESCSGEFFLFRGGCYKAGEAPGSSICTKAEGGKCTACNAANGLFQNPAASPTLGSECILCSDITSRDGVMGVANCNKCTAPSGTGPATCDTCQEGYYLNGADKTCRPCQGNCATCTGAGATNCETCKAGYYLKSDHSCIEESQCTGANYPDKQSGECKACSEITDCTACEYNDATGKPKCTNCNGGKKVKTALDGTTTCVDVATGCKDENHFQAESDAACYLCGENTSGSGNDKGILNCKTCTKSGAPPQCSACLDGYFYDSSQKTCTQQCGTNCATCSEATNPNKCSTCMAGFFLKGTAGGGQCVPCGDTTQGGIDGCAECDSQSSTLKCVDCKPNRKPVGTEGTQVTCEEKTCEDETACGGTAGACRAIVIGASGEMTYYCSQCVGAGYGPINGKCSNSLDSNTCKDGVCTQCAASYFLYVGGCYSTASAPGNLMCTATTNGICTTPTGQYFAVPGAAKTDQSVLGCGNPLGTNTTSTNVYVGVEDCRTCTAPSEASNGAMAAAKCTACDEGKALTGSGYGCVTCGVAGCSACRADNMCEACSDGHRLEGGTCVRTGGNLSTGAMAGISVTKSSYALCC
ncbi:Variant-specific surface protein, partial [Giardia duodenalis]